MISTIFTCLIALQFAAIVLHDWLDIPGWTRGRQVQAVVGRQKLLLATLINATFPVRCLAHRQQIAIAEDLGRRGSHER